MFKCEQCTAIFSRLDSLNRHVSSVHNHIHYKCNQCSQTFTRKDSSLLRHACKKKQYACDKCGLMVDSKHNCNKVSYVCQNCSQTFVYKIDFLQHTCEEIKCDICGKKFSHIGTRNRHIRSVHGNVGYKCDRCSKGFSRKDILAKHLDGCQGGYKCEVCGQVFSDRQVWWGHEGT